MTLSLNTAPAQDDTTRLCALAIQLATKLQHARVPAITIRRRNGSTTEAYRLRSDTTRKLYVTLSGELFYGPPHDPNQVTSAVWLYVPNKHPARDNIRWSEFLTHLLGAN